MESLYRVHHSADYWAGHSAGVSAGHRAGHSAGVWAGHWAGHGGVLRTGLFGLVRAGESGDTRIRHLLESAPEALRLLLSWLRSYSVVVFVAVAIGAGVVVAMRWFAVRRYLARRGPLVRLVPTPSFDPSPEEVLRFATTVLRTHRVTRLSGVRRASAVRVRLHQVDGRVVFDLEGHRRVESVLRVASYGSVERRVLRPAESPGLAADTVSSAAGRLVSKSVTVDLDVPGEPFEVEEGDGDV